MTDMASTSIRLSRPADVEQLDLLYPLAFPEEDLLAIMRALIGRDDVVSLVAVQGAAVVGHIAFSQCSLPGKDAKLSLLGPLCVHPDHQRSGFGGALINEGFKRLSAQGFAKVMVLGDPNYYGRFGFKADATVRPPYPLPSEWADAWQGLDLAESKEVLTGELIVPEPWRDPILWAD
jgi:putative acetyltransferase